MRDVIKQSLGSVPSRSQVSSWTWSWPRLPVAVHLSRFSAPSGVSELHATLRPTEYASIDTQLGWLEQAYQLALADAGVVPEDGLFRRFLCSDLPNQAAALRARSFSDPAGQSPCAVSWVGQPPAAPAKVALWAYHTADPDGPLDKRRRGETVSLRRGDLTHHWTCNLACPEARGSYEQTRAIFGRYEQLLGRESLTLADHVVRTWLFVQNVDANYHGLVEARKELFTARGLTPETHYIASTGIEGRAVDVGSLVAMDAYAIGGLQPAQVRHLAALDHLSPNHLYGVTFERATAISFRDRRHVYISGPRASTIAARSCTWGRSIGSSGGPWTTFKRCCARPAPDWPTWACSSSTCATRATTRSSKPRCASGSATCRWKWSSLQSAGLAGWSRSKVMPWSPPTSPTCRPGEPRYLSRASCSVETTQSRSSVRLR